MNPSIRLFPTRLCLENFSVFQFSSRRFSSTGRFDTTDGFIGDREDHLNCHSHACAGPSHIFRADAAMTKSHRNNVKISYAIYPEGQNLDSTAATPIFVLHGLFGSKKNWHSIAPLIATSTNRIVVTMDARNHGESDHAPVMTYAAMCDDLLGVMDKLKVKQPILLGHSMGGKTVMTCALTQPERVSSLIIVDVAPRPSPGIDSLLTYAQKMKELKLPSGVSFVEARRRIAKNLRPHVKNEDELLFLLLNLKEMENKTVGWRVNLDAVISNITELAGFPEFSSPCNIKTTFIGGALSRHINDGAVPHIKRSFPDATIKHIPGAGHWVHSEKPKEFVAAVTNFITKVHNDS